MTSLEQKPTANETEFQIAELNAEIQKVKEAQIDKDKRDPEYLKKLNHLHGKKNYLKHKDRWLVKYAKKVNRTEKLLEAIRILEVRKRNVKIY
jgi:iron-sulfur cluster repair protein YtfE (RIC family)